MARFLFALIGAAVFGGVVVGPVAASPVIVQGGQIGAIRVQLDSVPIAGLVTVLMRDIVRVPYSISPGVLGDVRPISVQLSLPRNDLAVSVVHYLRSIGLEVVLSSGTVLVSKPGEMDAKASPPPASSYTGSGDEVKPAGRRSEYVGPHRPARASGVQPAADVSGLPAADSGAGRVVDVDPDSTGAGQFGQAQPQAPAPPRDLMLVRPAHRSPAEISLLIRPLFPRIVIAERRGSAVVGESIVGPLETDVLAVSGSKEDLDRLETFVRAIDTPRPVVSVHGILVQVSTTTSTGSALTMLGSVLSSRLSFGLSSSVAPGDTFAKYTGGGGLSVAISALRADGRFKVIAEPSVLALSGSIATLNSGASVPTVAGVTLDKNGSPLQSIVYRDSGVTLAVQPEVRGGEIELDVHQERSSFAQTQTGVNNSPTLNHATAHNRFSLLSGETVALAALAENTTNSSRSGLFSRFMPVRNSATSDSQLVLLLQASVVDGAKVSKPIFQRFAAPEPDKKPAQDPEQHFSRRHPAPSPHVLPVDLVAQQ